MRGGNDWVLSLKLGKKSLSWVSRTNTIVDSIQCTMLQASGDQSCSGRVLGSTACTLQKVKQGSPCDVNKSASGQGPLAMD